MANVKQCFSCKEKFNKQELVDYASPYAKILHSYCPKCLKEKQAKDRFSDKVTLIFGIKAPGGRIWTERKRLIEKYGYTDDILIDCLDYIYKVEKKKVLAESLCLITPATVDKMRQYKREQEKQSLSLAAATNTSTQEYIVPIQENHKKNIINYDLDEWLD